MGAEGSTFVLVARTPRDGVAAFQQYEQRVLPLLAKYGGRLDRRLRNAEGTFEIHTLWFPSTADLEKFRADPERAAAAPLLEQSNAKSELHEVTDIKF